MSAATPFVDMCSGTGELSAAPAGDYPNRHNPDVAVGLRLRLAGNAVVADQAALTLTRGLEQLDAIDRKELP